MQAGDETPDALDLDEYLGRKLEAGELGEFFVRTLRHAYLCGAADIAELPDDSEIRLKIAMGDRSHLLDRKNWPGPNIGKCFEEGLRCKLRGGSFERCFDACMARQFRRPQ